MLKSAAAIEGAKERGGSSVVNLSSIAGLTALTTGMSRLEALSIAISQHVLSSLRCRSSPELVGAYIELLIVAL